MNEDLLLEHFWNMPQGIMVLAVEAYFSFTVIAWYSLRKRNYIKQIKSAFKHAEIKDEITNTEPDMFVLQQGKREWEELTYPEPDWNQLWQTLSFFLAYTCAGLCWRSTWTCVY